MIITDAIALLKTSELKQLGIKDDNASIINYINLGILELYKRFPLWEAEAVITQVADVSLYKLDGIDANVTIDLTDHELMVIDTVYDSEDLPYVINNEKDPLSIHTPKFNQIKVATIVPGDVMTVIYRAAPKFLTLVSDTIPLPPQFLEALFIYVGYKGHGSVKVGVKDENNTHYMRFEASCERITNEGLVHTPDLESRKFTQRGFA